MNKLKFTKLKQRKCRVQNTKCREYVVFENLFVVLVIFEVFGVIGCNKKKNYEF